MALLCAEVTNAQRICWKWVAASGPPTCVKTGLVVEGIHPGDPQLWVGSHFGNHLEMDDLTCLLDFPTCGMQNIYFYTVWHRFLTKIKKKNFFVTGTHFLLRVS